MPFACRSLNRKKLGTFSDRMWDSPAGRSETASRVPGCEHDVCCLRFRPTGFALKSRLPYYGPQTPHGVALESFLPFATRGEFATREDAADQSQYPRSDIVLPHCSWLKLDSSALNPTLFVSNPLNNCCEFFQSRRHLVFVGMAIVNLDQLTLRVTKHPLGNLCLDAGSRHQRPRRSS
jgi:hypothetical protein